MNSFKSALLKEQKQVDLIIKELPESLILKMCRDASSLKEWESINDSEYQSMIESLLSELHTDVSVLCNFEEIKKWEYSWYPTKYAILFGLWRIEKPKMIVVWDTFQVEYQSRDGYNYSYLEVDNQRFRECRYPTKEKIAQYYDTIYSDESLVNFRMFLQENQWSKVVVFGDIQSKNLIPTDCENIISVWGFIDISVSSFHHWISFPDLEYIQDDFYYIETSGGEKQSPQLKRILPHISQEYKENHCIPMNIIESEFYKEAELINVSSQILIDANGTPQSLKLFFPLFDGIRKDILWFQDLLQWLKKISPQYSVTPDFRNTPNSPVAIWLRQTMVKQNRVEVVIKVPKGAFKSNDNENYIFINNPQAQWGVPKNILFMDLTKNFPKDMKKVLEVIDTFLKWKLMV